MEENKKLNEQETIVEQENNDVPPVQLEEDDGTDTTYSVPWKGLIFIGVIITLMAACIIVIACLGGFNA